MHIIPFLGNYAPDVVWKRIFKELIMILKYSASLRDARESLTVKKLTTTELAPINNQPQVHEQFNAHLSFFPNQFWLLFSP